MSTYDGELKTNYNKPTQLGDIQFKKRMVVFSSVQNYFILKGQCHKKIVDKKKKCLAMVAKSTLILNNG